MIKSIKKSWVIWSVFFIHMAFTFIKIFYFIEDSDALFYWMLEEKVEFWMAEQPLPIGNSLMVYLNYPLFKWLNLPIEFGFILYGLVSFLGFVFLYQWWYDLYNGKLKEFLVLILLIIPSFHFWHNGLGKEALLFPTFVIVFYHIFKQNYKSIPLISSVLIITLIRPHVAAILLLSYMIYFLIFDFRRNKKSYTVLIVLISTFLVSYYLIKYTSPAKRFISLEFFESILNAHHRVFKQTNSYVPLETYNYPYKLFTFYFRPLLGEQPGFYALASALENLTFLIVFIIASLVKVFYYKTIKFPKVFYLILIFSLVYASVFVLAYSNFGIILRTKSLVTPFLWMICFYIIGTFITQRQTLHKKQYSPD